MSLLSSWFHTTADSIVAKFTSVISELETHAETKIAEEAQHLFSASGFAALAAEAKAEYTKAQGYAAALKKTLLG